MIRRIVLTVALLTLAGVLYAPGAASQETSPELERARELMRQVPLIDGHNDLPWALRVDYGMDWDSLDISQPQPQLMTDIPRLREGRVGGQFWSTYVPSSFDGNGAGRAGAEENDIVHRMIERYPDVFELALTADDILRIHREGKIASLLGLEGGHMIENSLGMLRAFYRDGVRYMTLTHSRNTDWADAATDSLEHGGLTRFGEEVVREMNRLGMLVDLSHASDSMAWDVLRVTEAPVILSHSSSRRFTPHPRNIPDDLAAAVAENGGVIMVNFVLPFIYLPAYEWYTLRGQMRSHYREITPSEEAASDSLDAWEAANPRPMPDIRVVADHIEHLRDVAGADHIGIGSDFDGIEVPPEGLEDVSKYPELIAELLRRGWSDEDAMKLIGVNLLRAMKEAESVAERLQPERAPSAAQIEILDGWDSEPPWRRPNP
jgi:membrane dipeptidase